MITLHRRLVTAALAGAFGLGSLAAGLAPALADNHHGDNNRNAGWHDNGGRRDDHRDYNRDWRPAPVYNYPAPVYSYPTYPTYPAYGYYQAPANGYYSVGVPIGGGYLHVGGGF